MRISITVEVDPEKTVVDSNLASVLRRYAYLGVRERWRRKIVDMLVSSGSLPLEEFAPTQKSTIYFELRDE